MNSKNAKIFSAVLPISWITSVCPVIRQSFMGTSSISIIIRQVLVNSSLASICHAPLTVKPCCSNTPLWFPLVHFLDSYRNLLMGLSIQFHWPAMSPVLQLGMDPQWQLHCLNQPHTVPAAYTWNIIFTVLAPITPYWFNWMWYWLMAHALHSMRGQTRTSSKHILKSNSTMMATHILVLSLHLNLSGVLALLINWHIASHNHHTNSALTLWCLLTLLRGYSNKSTLIWCIWGIPIAKYSHQTSLPHLLPLSRLLSMVPLAFGYLCMTNGYKLIPTTQRWASYATSSLILPR